MDTRLDGRRAEAEAAPRQLLPIDAYTGEEWFRRERKSLFGRSWLFAGMTEDLPRPGSYRCLDAGEAPLILLRDHEGRLRAFHNVCRHRGARLLEGEGTLGRRITCFYHSWSYELDGRLASVTFEEDQFRGIEKSCHGLHPARVATWKNLVFVNAGAAAEPFDEQLGDVTAKMGPHDPEQRHPFEPERLVELWNITYRVAANWKVIVENFIDGYHLPLLHPVSLGDGDFLPQRWEAAGRHISFYRPQKPGARHDKQALPLIEGVPPSFGAAYYWLFPNVAIYETATTWSTFHVIPLEPGLSLIQSRMRGMPEALRRDGVGAAPPERLPPHIVSATGAYAGIRAHIAPEHPLRSNNVMLEDIYACEAVQKGMQSPLCRIGPLSRWEATLPFFQQHVLDALRG
jgi:Rieske 2Fe-2S family protein